MKIIELITLAENKLAALNQAMATAHRTGNVGAIPEIENEIAETQATLDELRNLVQGKQG